MPETIQGIVPLPQKRSASGLDGFHTEKSIKAAASVSFIIFITAGCSFAACLSSVAVSYVNQSSPPLAHELFSY